MTYLRRRKHPPAVLDSITALEALCVQVPRLYKHSEEASSLSVKKRLAFVQFPLRGLRHRHRRSPHLRLTSSLGFQASNDQAPCHWSGVHYEQVFV